MCVILPDRGITKIAETVLVSAICGILPFCSVIRERFVLLAYIFDYQAITTHVYVSMYHSVYHIWYVDEDKITPDFGPVKATSLILTIISRISSN